MPLATGLTASGQWWSADGEGGEARFEEDTDIFRLRRREFSFPGIPAVVLRQEFLCVEGTGGAVWRPSIRFAEFVCSQEGRRSLPIAGKSVLEISSGLGLGAIVAWRLGASPVVATDIDSEHGPLRLLEENIRDNCGQLGARAGRPISTSCSCSRKNQQQQKQEDQENCSSTSPPLLEPKEHTPEQDAVSGAQGASIPTLPPPVVKTLRWGNRAQLLEAVASLEGHGPDIILACDVVFDETMLPALTQTLLDACALRTRDGGRPVLCVSHQRRNRAREEAFFADVSSHLGQGLEVHREEDVSVFIFRCV
ncbi:unnamed protein product [Ascophyllum nodosum]